MPLSHFPCPVSRSGLHNPVPGERHWSSATGSVLCRWRCSQCGGGEDRFDWKATLALEEHKGGNDG